jgi:hypothetical protein
MDPGLLDEVVSRCAMLPLAIYVAAARMRSHPAWNVPDLLERLDEHGQRLAELVAGERSVAEAFDLSYGELTADQKRAYRMLSRHMGAGFDPRAAASMLVSGVVEVRRVLDGLVGARLLQEPTAGRYRFHDLIRDHAVTIGSPHCAQV